MLPYFPHTERAAHDASPGIGKWHAVAGVALAIEEAIVTATWVASSRLPPLDRPHGGPNKGGPLRDAPEPGWWGKASVIMVLLGDGLLGLRDQGEAPEGMWTAAQVIVWWGSYISTFEDCFYDLVENDGNPNALYVLLLQQRPICCVINTTKKLHMYRCHTWARAPKSAAPKTYQNIVRAPKSDRA